MSESTPSGPIAESVEDMLLGELAQGDVILSTARPILRHLLANDEHALFNDAVIATIRGMMVHLARQMLFELAASLGQDDRGTFVAARQDALATSLLGDTGLLGHAHALTIEAQLADRLHARSGIDPVLSPLMQDLAASRDEDLATMAMRVVASQARFMQHQRRMELPLDELPASLHDAATRLLKATEGDWPKETHDLCERLREQHGDGERRIGQINRLLRTLGEEAGPALSIEQSGLAIFATALSLASAQDRDVVVLSLAENQRARLALSLRAAGLEKSAVEQQFLYLHPEVSPPSGFDAMPVDRALALLNTAAPGAAH